MDIDQFRAELLTLVPRLRAYAIALTGSRAAGDDLLQETILRAWRFKDRFHEGSNLSAWTHTIMRNTHRSAATSQKRFVQDVDGLHAGRASCEPEQEWSVRYGEMLAALQKLSFKTRDALLLVVGEGLSYEEAGVIAGCPAGTIKSRVNRARQQLAHLTAVHLNEFDRVEVRAARPRAVVSDTTRQIAGFGFGGVEAYA